MLFLIGIIPNRHCPTVILAFERIFGVPAQYLFRQIGGIVFCHAFK